MINGDELGLAALRAVQLISLISLAGALLFDFVIVAPMLRVWGQDTMRGAQEQLATLIRLSWLAASLSTAGWFFAESASIAGASNAAAAAASLPAVALQTQFGHVMLA